MRNQQWTKQVFVALIVSCGYSWSLGVIYALHATGGISLTNLFLPAVLPVFAIVSTIIAVLVTPVAVWSLRTGAKNLRLYGFVLWIVLAGYELIVPPGVFGLGGVIVLALAGLLALGFSPKRV